MNSDRLPIQLPAKQGMVEIPDPVVRALQSKNPTKDVPRELDAMLLWLTRHEKRRPVNVWRFIDHWLAKAPAVRRPPEVTLHAWWTTDARTVQQGHAIGVEARPGESMAAFRDRIAARMAQGATKH